MEREVRGAFAASKGARVAVTGVRVPDPGPGEVLVRVRACGVCHTDLLLREGTTRDDFPVLLGHEAAGTVEAIGDDVSGLVVGDSVVLAWLAPCGLCRACQRGRPSCCSNSRKASQPMTLADGTPLSKALGIGGFAELTLVASGQAIKIDSRARPEAAALIGCGITAGYGAALHTGEVKQADTVAVFGCGAVGAAAVHASAMVGARRVIAVDIDDRKLQWALELGATDAINATRTDPVRGVQAVTDGLGADVTIEAVGLEEVMQQAFRARDYGGTMVQVGVPERSMRMDVPFREFFTRGGALKPSHYGDCLPARDFPVLVDLYLRGRFDLDRFVSETIGLDEVEGAFAKMRSSQILRSVVVFP